jgi:uncharacterized protein
LARCPRSGSGTEGLFACWYLLALTPSLAAAAPPTCQGRDLFAEMKTADPKGFAEVRAAADAVPNARSIFWRIEKPGLPASFLFGTIHSTDERTHRLSPAVASALEGANTVALELAESASGTAADAMGNVKNIDKLMVYQGGNGLIDHLSTDEFATLTTALGAVGFPAAAVHALRPWLVYMGLAFPACEQRRGKAGLPTLDKLIGQDALQRGIRVIGLERIEDQVGALVGMPEATQIFLLKSALALIDDQVHIWEVLQQLYIARDLGVILPFSKLLAERAGLDTSLGDRFERDLIDVRNIKMRDAARPLIQKGNAFIAVGALHLPGKAGLVELLRAEGFTVTGIE